MRKRIGVMGLVLFRTTCLIAFEQPSMETSLVRACILPGCLIYPQFIFSPSRRPISVTQLTFLRDGAVCNIEQPRPTIEQRRRISGNRKAGCQKTKQRRPLAGDMLLKECLLPLVTTDSPSQCFPHSRRRPERRSSPRTPSTPSSRSPRQVCRKQVQTASSLRKGQIST